MNIINNDKSINSDKNQKELHNGSIEQETDAIKLNDKEPMFLNVAENSKNGKSFPNSQHNGTITSGKNNSDNGKTNGETSENHKHDNHRSLPELENKSDMLSGETAVEIQFQGSRREFYYTIPNSKLFKNEYVLVETENGTDIGRIVDIGANAFKKWQVQKSDNSGPVYSIKYKAGQKELQRHNSNLNEQKKILDKVRELIAIHKLEMRVTEVEWQFDHHRLTIFFLSPQRIDFRELVKDLAKEYKTRIELRQITHRERAKRISMWEGVCGRSICCSTFLNNIRPITIEHSKAQQLSSNVTKLSGYCGRLKCCLAFEYDFYTSESERFPKLGSILNYSDNSFKLIKFDIFKESLLFLNTDNHIFRNFSLEEVRKFAQDGLIIEPKESHCPVCDELNSPEDIKELMSIAGE